MDMGNDDFLRGLFDDIDEDGSGVLDRGEIAELARKLLGVLRQRRAASRAALATGEPSCSCKRNTKGYSSTDLAVGFANVRAGTRYPFQNG